MELSQLKSIVEAMIFVSEEPITDGTMLIALSDAGVDREELNACIASIQRDYDESPERGVQMVEVAGGYQFRTKLAYAEWIRRLNVPKPLRLSGPALETLAIVAYKQPIVRSEIEKIRGVDSGGVLKTLLERRLLRIVGRQDEPGQPLLYGTTKDFLEVFNLRTLKELPTLKDVEDLLRERRAVTDSRRPENIVPVGVESEDETSDLPKENEEGSLVIERYSLDSDVEAEKVDMEALTDLEQNLKDLRRLERKIFPKPIVMPGLEGEEGDDAFGTEGVCQEVLTQEAPLPETLATDGARAAENAGENAPTEDDRAGE